ncbi:CRISPR-associated endonuclease/helicase Cas3 [Marinomonas aquimarina]|uniref:CRISPR-associated endonuclease/helicase Cas3 n=1 Tax=Marinomonas aquimarina TaxID=295068 RepID=A0A1A8T8N4_9GAMM|nr:CRISPR-associated helicase/endonuclease Cas3 [Marinomonas aquimarina]SBS27680.1 CRISPR-associated endonuclease/helicase Cas3 [Marinomonas aquimarina]
MELTNVASYFFYWGKAQKNELDSKGDPYHLLPFHCLDVAAVGKVLLTQNKALTKNIASFLELDEEAFISLFIFCLLLHDLGKFASAFQALFKDETGFLFDANPTWHYNSKEHRHDQLGLFFWHELRELAELFPTSLSDAEEPQVFETFSVLMECSLGHHGKPIRFEKPSDLKRYIQKHNVAAAKSFVLGAYHLIKPSIPFEKFLDASWRARLKQVSWLLAGVAVLADWIGSDRAYFPYRSVPVEALGDYWKEALASAQLAWQATRLDSSASIKPFQSVQAQFGFSPTPLQAWAESVDIDDSPQLFILEDITGSGKTEAAQVLLHRLLEAGAADGFYFGLPTMATSNAMYQRVLDHYSSMYQDQSALPSIVLAHGARDMNEQFQATLMSEGSSETSYTCDDQTATAQCSQWLGDSRKKALLAPIGVGTIDQTLLAVLPRRHQSLRLLGLHRKVLVFDEVHAADEYMFELLESLLSLHLHFGCSAILLTATLSQQQRQRLTDIWLSTSTHSGKQLEQTHFPLATKVSLSSEQPLLEQPLDSREDVSRSVAVHFIDQKDTVVEKVVQAAKAGKCVVWIRNSVDDAISAYTEIREQLDNPDNALLFHSRFALSDRQAIEHKVLNWFGKHSDAPARHGKVLVATQVFQESLDADADLMISDLCLIDDLIQRAGRLHRHTRNAQRERELGIRDTRPAPLLYVHAPAWSDDPSVQWLSEVLPSAQAVYRSPGRLWLGMKKLRELGGIHMPEKARDLIEAVYSSEAQMQIPKALEKAELEACGEQASKVSAAKFNRLQWQNYGYSTQSNQQWYDDQTDISTRYSNLEYENILLLKRDSKGELVPYADQPKFAVPLSTFKVLKSKFADQLTQISEEEKLALETRYPSAKYLQPWLASDDPSFSYSDVFGFGER